jgi:hypothetical protein
MAFAIVKSKTPTGIGQLFKDAEGQNACKLVQIFTDYGITSNLTIKDNFGNNLFKWSLIWAKDVGRRQAKEVIRTLLNHMDITKNFEMYVCSTIRKEMLFGTEKTIHMAFDMDDSYQNSKVKITEASKRWKIIKNYNYRAPESIRYDEILENFQTCDKDYKEMGFFNSIQEQLQNQ